MSAVGVLYLAAFASIMFSAFSSKRKASGLPVWVLLVSGIVLAVDAL